MRADRIFAQSVGFGLRCSLMGFVTVTLGLLVKACVAPLDPMREDSHFRHPEQFVGQTVTVCGYVTFQREDQNIWYSKDESLQPFSLSMDGGTRGLGLLIDEEVRLGAWPHGRSGCFKGRIVYTGCWDRMADGTDTLCPWTPFDHALLISRTPDRDSQPLQSPSSGTP